MDGRMIMDGWMNGRMDDVDDDMISDIH